MAKIRGTNRTTWKIDDRYARAPALFLIGGAELLPKLVKGRLG